MNQEVDYIVEPSGPVSFHSKKHRVSPEMDITPMIDITFLLLIFFLVASRLSQETMVELPSAQHGTTVSADTSVIVTVTQGRGEHANIYKGDGIDESTRLRSTNLEDQQQELRQFIESGLTNDQKTQVLIKAEQGVRHGDVARVAKAAGSATAHVMYLAVMEER